MITSSVLFIGGIAMLASSFVATIVCVIIGHKKRRDLKNYYNEWY